jgi:phosphinothricin acetyltransferase
MIRPATTQDAAALAAIYNHYIVNTVVTFEETPISAEDMKARLAEVAAANLPWLVAEEGGKVVGYAYASKWKGRCAYRYSVESSAYLAPEAVSRGWGTKLYTALFAALREKSIHAVIGGIALPNPASVALHEKFGMQKVAHFSEVGYKFKQWVDVGYWQMKLPASQN